MTKISVTSESIAVEAFENQIIAHLLVSDKQALINEIIDRVGVKAIFDECKDEIFEMLDRSEVKNHFDLIDEPDDIL